MKVLHVAPSIAQSYGGPTHSLAGYAKASRHAGIDVSIAAPQSGAADQETFMARSGDIDLHLFRTLGAGAFVASPALVRWVSRSAKSYDVVHVHGLFNPISSLSARAARRAGTPVVIRPFGTLSKYTFLHRRTNLKKAYFWVIERGNLRDAAALHFTSEAERGEADWHGIDFTGRAWVIPPPALGDTVLPIAPPHPSDGGEKVIFIGRIDRVKNLEALLDAWLFVRRRLPGAVLEVAGEGRADYLATLHRRAAMNGVADSVAFRGFVSGVQKETMLSSATVLVLPSHHENFGVVVLEALAAGVPVVVSPDVHLADFVLREKLGKVAPANPALLADAILEVIGNDDLRNRARVMGADIVARTFSVPAIGELLSKMYDAAIQRSPRAASL